MATTTNFGWETPDDTDLVKDGAAAIRTSLNGVDSSFVDLKGGTTGQVLSKASGTDLDFTWVAQDDSNAIQNAIVDAKGDLIVGASADTPARLAVGTNGYVLTANSSATNGVEWAAASGASGLNLIVAQTFSASSVVNLTSCFSSTYETYQIVLNGTTSGNAAIYAQMRQGSTNITTASYEIRNPGVVGPASSWQLTYAGGISCWAVDMSVYSPTTTGFPAMTFNNICLNSGAGAQGTAGGGFYDASVTGGYDGISFAPNTGTMTGSVRVYGRKKSI